MTLNVRESPLGVDVMDADRPLALYRVRDQVSRWESPKPSFAPIFFGDGRQLTEHRPWDHLWHTGLFFGWVHANDSNLWGGAWYTPETGKYERVETHGIQRHDQFNELGSTDAGGVRIDHHLSWLDAEDHTFATEQRVWDIEPFDGGTRWCVDTTIQPVGRPLTLGATRAEARYSGLVLRMGPTFGHPESPASESHAWCSEGREGHAQIMGQPARWVAAAGASGGMVAMFDHPANPRYPSTWFCRANLLGPALLAPGDLVTDLGESLQLRYAMLLSDESLGTTAIEAEYSKFAAS